MDSDTTDKFLNKQNGIFKSMVNYVEQVVQTEKTSERSIDRTVHPTDV